MQEELRPVLLVNWLAKVILAKVYEKQSLEGDGRMREG